MGSTYNISTAAQTQLAIDGTSLNVLLAGAIGTVYDGRQPLDANTALSGNNSMATFPFPVGPLGIYGHLQIDVLDPLPDTVWTRASTPTFMRVKQGTTTVFDCSVGQKDTEPDLVIKQSPVRAGDLAHVDNGIRKMLGRRRKVIVSAS